MTAQPDYSYAELKIEKRPDGEGSRIVLTVDTEERESARSATRVLLHWAINASEEMANSAYRHLHEMLNPVYRHGK